VIVKLIKFNAWYALACGVFCLMVAPMIVDSALMSLGARPERVMQDETYLLAVTFVRIVGILLFAYTLTIRLLLKQHFDPQDVRGFFTLWAVGLLCWGGMFLIVIFTKSAILASACGLGLLEWLMIPAVLLFVYKGHGNR
jgi:hypothetical protein